jgi:hypothetical protein
MKNEKINEALRTYVQENLTPTPEERSMVAAVYASVCAVLGRDRCRQIGSYPRYTAIRPPHDLDILYNADKWPGAEPDAGVVINRLRELLEELEPPYGLTATVALQTHSVTVSFKQGEEEVFAVDIVPAWTTGSKNEFDEDIYWVPEILLRGHRGRLKTYKRLAEQGGSIHYILSDPKGYISIAAGINEANQDFRKSVKLPKKWKWWCKKADEEFKLKSFHIEQIITSYFLENPDMDILEAVTRFVQELPQWISHAQIPDRADPTRNIDAYVDDLTAQERAAILTAGDRFLERLKAFDGSESVESLFQISPRAKAAAATSGVSVTPIVVTERRSVTPRPPFGSDS